MTPILLGSFFLIVHFYCIITKRDLWPFSCYPMFSKPKKVADVVCFRLAIEGQDEKRLWWQSRFKNYEQTLRRELRVVFEIPADKRPPELFRKILKRILFFAGMDVDLKNYQKIHVVRRWAEPQPGDRFEFREETVFSMSIDDLVKEAFVV